MNSTASTISLSEAIDALTSTSDHLNFITGLLKRSEFSEETRKDLNRQVNLIYQRLHDPNLYLAVVGEFSSGKSTLINALLRDELLKTSALVTTATATRILHDCALTVEIEFQGKRPGVLKTRPDSQQITVPWIPKINGIDNRQLIHLVTTDEAITADVIRITVYHPANFLSSGIVIIDTPGTNATQIEHARITQQVVELEADAAIVIIPATIPLSQSLSNFLQSSLCNYLHRCIFVVTRMDQIRESEQDALLIDLKLRLKEKLGIEPLIHSCAAQVLLDYLQGESINAKEQIWITQFEQLEELILNRLRQERSLNISERILRLLTGLLQKLEQQLENQYQNYEKRRSTIQKELIPELSLFIDQQHQEAKNRVRTAISNCLIQINFCVEKYRENTVQKIRNSLFSITDESLLKNFTTSEVKFIFQQEYNKLSQELNIDLLQLTQAATQISHTFDQRFVEIYQRLQSLSHLDVQIPALATLQFEHLAEFTETQSTYSQLMETSGNWVLGGVGSGALVGTMLFPGLGTIIGGAIGLGLSFLATPSLSDQQQQIWDKLRPELDAYFNSVKTGVQESIETQSRAMIAEIYEHIEQYSQYYKQTVERILNEQKKELITLDRLRQQIESDREQICLRQKTLLAQQQRLAANVSIQ